MSTNGTNVCEDAEMADCDGEKVVTMMDVLKEQEDFEEDANAVLGASDDKNCTYSKGYVKRQAIYACMTCCTDAKNDPNSWAGVCLACSLTCHENHELIELYTKRNFRCDCGNPKFNSHPCQFTPNKTDLNEENIYNQNFSGIYCICHRPYPDPDSSSQGDMIQCIICEDWLHSNHLDAIVPSNDQYSEMICKACMDKNEFLHDYSELAVNKENMDVDILNISSEDNPLSNCNGNSNTELVAISNNDVILSADKENDSILEKPNEETEKIVENNTKSEPDEEKVLLKQNEENIVTSENNVIPSESKQIKSSAENVCDTENETKEEIETEQKSETQPEVLKTENIKESNKDAVENQNSLVEEEITTTDKSDNRTQEQVEEDFLLADPMDTDRDQKVDTTDIAPPIATQSTTDELIEEEKSKSEAMETSELTSEDQGEKTEDKSNFDNESYPDSTSNTEQSENVPNDEESKDKARTEQSESNTPIEQMKDALNTSQLDNVTTADNSVTTRGESAADTKISENISYNEQSKIESTSEEEESVTTNKPSDNADDENDMNREESVDESNTTNEKNNTLDKDNIVNDDSKTAIKPNCDNEIADKTVETDILKRKLITEDIESVEVKKPKLDDNKCVRPVGIKKVHRGATFWPSNFRCKLCTCNECISMYKDLSVLFLIDPEDTVTAYETLGKEKTEGKPASQYEKGMAALSSLGRVQQINALTEYTKLRDKLLDFLKTFKDKKVIVKEEDIKAFFAGMKPVREPDGVYFCR